jgi:transcriptional regulator with XRE-family HTH domain
VTVQRERVVHPLNVVFGDEIRARRHEAGLSQVKLGEILGCTGQWICQVENGDKDPSREFALDLDTYFVTSGTFMRMTKEIKKLGRRLIHLSGFQAYLEAEAKAVFVGSFDSQLVPGLLQKESYARAVISMREGADTLEELVAARLERQEIFSRKNPARGLFVLDEAVLHRAVGGAEVMRQQLKWLEELASSTFIEVRILPFTSITYAGLEGSFVLLDLFDGSSLVYLEAPTLSQLTGSRDNVAECRVRFDLVMGEALPRTESLKMIRRVREAL